MPRTMLLLSLAAGVAAVAAALGVAQYAGDKAAAPGFAVGAASYRWPAETLRDWTDFADQLSVLSIESEQRLPRTPEEIASGEGYVGRRVTVRVEETLWRNPGSPTVEGKLTFVTWGWTAKHGRLIPAIDSSSYRLEVGDRVLTPLLLTPEGTWAPLPTSAIPLVNGRTAFADRQRQSRRELAADLDGITPRSVADRLAAVQPRPNAAALRRLEPDARARELARNS